MPGYRLGAYQLPAAEVILLRTLLRLFAHDQNFRWHFVDEAPFDALIVDGTGSDLPAKQAEQEARAVLSLIRTTDPDGPNRLPRPLRAGRLQQWLLQIQNDVLEPNGQTQTSEGVAAKAPESESESASEPETAFKLKRWPPVSLLHRDPVRIRMATLMSRRFLKISELASITGLSTQEIRPFVHNLQMVGLVELERQKPSFAPANLAKKPPSPDQGGKKKGFFGKGLIGSIRKRLSL